MVSTKANSNQFFSGDHKVNCDVCAQVYMRSECKKTWDNLIACPKCYDPKHPQLTIKGYGDKQAIRDARPPQEDPPLTPDYTEDDMV